MALLVRGGEGLVLWGEVPLEGEPVAVVRDDEIEAAVEARPPPHVLAWRPTIQV